MRHVGSERRLLIGCYNRSVIITYIGIGAALAGMFRLLQGGAGTDIKTGLISLIIAGICDLFDGPVARKCKRTEMEKAFGMQIDSLADVIISLVMPVILLFRMEEGQQIRFEIVFVAAVIYTLAGVTRLAWFPLQAGSEASGGVRYYKGLPVTYMALILPIYWVICRNVAGFGLITVLLYMLVAFLFVCNVNIRKPTGIWYVIFPCLSVIVVGWICIL